MAKAKFERTKPHCNIGTIGHVDHASGLSEQDVQHCIRRGICKVNVATELKIAFADALKGYFYNNPAANDPRHYMQPAKAAMKEVVTRIIGVCGSEGKI